MSKIQIGLSYKCGEKVENKEGSISDEMGPSKVTDSRISCTALFCAVARPLE
jgi:hypothetical protein